MRVALHRFGVPAVEATYIPGLGGISAIIEIQFMQVTGLSEHAANRLHRIVVLPSHARALRRAIAALLASTGVSLESALLS
jgi:hypothetical protein